MADDPEHPSIEGKPTETGMTRTDFLRLYPKLAARFRALGAPHEEARDLVQKTLLEAHRNLEKFEGRSQLDTWVVSIAKNLWLRHLRDQRRQKRSGEEIALDIEIPAANLEDQVIARDRLERVRAAIRALPADQQQPLLLLVRGFKYREIARLLGTSENRISSLIYQARAKLRRQF